MKRRLVFYPLFLAMGSGDATLYMAGYDDNWRVHIGTSSVNGKLEGKYRKKGGFPNIVLFSFEEVSGVFMDYHAWHIALNASWRKHRLTDYEKRLIFKPSWPRSRWIQKVKNDSGSVQLVASELFLPSAKRVYVRNRATKKALEESGFGSIEIKRIPLNSW